MKLRSELPDTGRKLKQLHEINEVQASLGRQSSFDAIYACIYAFRHKDDLFALIVYCNGHSSCIGTTQDLRRRIFWIVVVLKSEGEQQVLSRH